MYYPDFCSALGQKDARSKQCGMNRKGAKERDTARKSMLDAAISWEMSKMADRGKSFKSKKNYFLNLVQLIWNNFVMPFLF